MLSGCIPPSSNLKMSKQNTYYRMYFRYSDSTLFSLFWQASWGIAFDNLNDKTDQLHSITFIEMNTNKHIVGMQNNEQQQVAGLCTSYRWSVYIHSGK